MRFGAPSLVISSLSDFLADCSYQQLHGAAQGLNYLHDLGLAHGDMKGVRV